MPCALKAATARPVSRRRAAWVHCAPGSSPGTQGPGTQPTVLRDAPSAPARPGAAQAGRENSPAGLSLPDGPVHVSKTPEGPPRDTRYLRAGNGNHPWHQPSSFMLLLAQVRLEPGSFPRFHRAHAVPWPEAAACLRDCSSTPHHAPAVTAVTVTQDKLNCVQQQLSVSTQGLLKLDRKQQPATGSIDLFSQHIRRLQKDTYQPPKKITPVLLLST